MLQLLKKNTNVRKISFLWISILWRIILNLQKILSRVSSNLRENKIIFKDKIPKDIQNHKIQNGGTLHTILFLNWNSFLWLQYRLVSVHQQYLYTIYFILLFYYSCLIFTAVLRLPDIKFHTNLPVEWLRRFRLC